MQIQLCPAVGLVTRVLVILSNKADPRLDVNHTLCPTPNK